MPVLKNPRHEKFACGVAGGLSGTKAYASAGYKGKGAAQAAERLLRKVDVRSRVTELTSAITVRAVDLAIAKRDNRVAALNDRWDRMRRVIEARAVEYAEIPGGETGLLVKQMKSIGFGKDNKIVEEYAVDAGLLRELRAHEQQAAQELGQWTEKTEQTGEIVVTDARGKLANLLARRVAGAGTPGNPGATK